MVLVGLSGLRAVAEARGAVQRPRAGAPAVINTALAAGKKRATLGVVAVQKEPVPIEFVHVVSALNAY